MLFLYRKNYGGCDLTRLLPLGFFLAGRSLSCGSPRSLSNLLRISSSPASWRNCFTLAINPGSGSFGAMGVLSPPALSDTHAHCNPRSLATACVGRMNKAMARSLAKRRADHAQRRLKQLRLILPELPPDVLERCHLRQLSFAIRRCGGPCQLPLQSVGQTAQASDESGLCLSPASLPGFLCSPSPGFLGES